MKSAFPDRGVTMVETMIAILVAFIAMASVGSVIFSAMVANKNQGTEGSRETVLAQQKMEELLRLNFADVSTNTTLITDTSWSIGLTPNPSTDLNYLTSCPSSGADIGYVDFLDANGYALAGSCTSVIAQTYGYERRWEITDVSGVSGLRQITVVVYAPNAVNTGARGTTPPSVALTSLKSQ
jgi:hypothetical protein